MFSRYVTVIARRNIRLRRKSVKITSSNAIETRPDINPDENVPTTVEEAVPLSDDDLVKLQERFSSIHSFAQHNRELNNTEQDSQASFDTKPPKPKKRLLIDYKGKHPLVEPITVKNQHERLIQAVTPLVKLPYHKQLNLKQDHATLVSRYLKKELRQAKAPLLPSINRLLCPIDRICGSPEIVSYRNKDEFSVNVGVDRNPKTVGYYVGLPKDPMMTCVPATQIPIIRNSHKLIAEHFQHFIRSSSHDACILFKNGGVWKNLVVRSNLKDERMATVIIYPKCLEDGEKDRIKEDLKEYFFNGPGTECNLSSLYLQACPHTRCSREKAPYELIAGETHLTEECLGKQFKISPDSFFQTNTKAAEILYETVMKMAEVSSLTTVLDICCGTGTISNLIAPHVRGCIGIDVVSAAIEDAKLNAAANGISNVNFIPGQVEKILPILTKDLNECSEVIAIVNPARGGLDSTVIHSLRNCQAIKKILLVSCHPEGNVSKNIVTLGTTLPSKQFGKLKQLGDPFVPSYMSLIDIFPQTLHLEYVILFERMKYD